MQEPRWCLDAHTSIHRQSFLSKFVRSLGTVGKDKARWCRGSTWRVVQVVSSPVSARHKTQYTGVSMSRRHHGGIEPSSNYDCRACERFGRSVIGFEGIGLGLGLAIIAFFFKSLSTWVGHRAMLRGGCPHQWKRECGQSVGKMCKGTWGQRMLPRFWTV